MVQMPALNTPQFNWVKSRLPRKPQPVPPIYQPEIAANAIYHAAHHYRREWYVGGSTAIVITGNKIAPGFGDWYLGHQGYDAQQYNGPVSPDRKNNAISRWTTTAISAPTATSTNAPPPRVTNSGSTNAATGSPWPAWRGRLRRSAKRSGQVLARRSDRAGPRRSGSNRPGGTRPEAGRGTRPALEKQADGRRGGRPVRQTSAEAALPH